MRRLIAAIRENDERNVEEAVLQLARTRTILAPLALAAGASVMLFNRLRLLLGGGGVTIVAADEVVVDADVPEIPVGIDGETIMMCTLVRCTIQARALRVRVTKDCPGSARQSLPSTGRLWGSWHRRAADVQHGGCSPLPGVSAPVTPCDVRRSPSVGVSAQLRLPYERVLPCGGVVMLSRVPGTGC